MTVSNLGTNNTFGLNASIAFTCATSAAAGNLVVVFVFDGNASFSGNSVTDSKGNTYIQGASQVSGGGGGNFIFYSFVTTPLTTSDTITYNCAAGYATQTLEIMGAVATGYGSVDNGSTATTNTFGSTWTVTSAAPAAVANEIYFGFAIATAPVQTSTWTTLNSSGSSFLPAYFINTGTSAQTFNGTNTSSWTQALVMAFQPSGGGGGGGGSFLLSSTSLIFM